MMPHQVAEKDNLTGFLNRHDFERLLDHIINRPSLKQHHHLCLINLDRFKVINDTYGCAAGDQLLKDVADMLAEQVDRIEIVSRFGSDEFALLLTTDASDDGESISHQILAHINAFNFTVERDTSINIKITASIGLVTVEPVARKADQVIKDANIACMAAKAKGRNRVHKYDKDDAYLRSIKENIKIAHRLKKDIERGYLFLYVQQISSLQDKGGLCYEVLLRAKDERGSMLMPGEFLPAAREYGLSVAIDKWVVTNTIGWLDHHKTSATEIESLSINLSGAAINDDEFWLELRSILESSPAWAEKIKFEVTETDVIYDLAAANKHMRSIIACGSRFSLDDFGTGSSSYEYLRHLPFSEIKIDGLFISNILSNKVDKAIVEAINHIGHTMGLRTVAEFVESQGVSDQLKSIGIDYIQGYHIGRPVQIEMLPTLVKQSIQSRG